MTYFESRVMECVYKVKIGFGGRHELVNSLIQLAQLYRQAGGCQQKRNSVDRAFHCIASECDAAILFEKTEDSRKNEVKNEG